MERVKKLKKVDLIFCADIHVRETHPICRTDDFCEVTQWRKLSFIYQLQMQHNCPVFHSGDLFHHWKPSPALLSKTLEYLPNSFYTVYGNHDLPQHNLELKDKCGIYTLLQANYLSVLGECSWGQIPKEGSWHMHTNNRTILVWHKFVANSETKLWPGAEVSTAKSLLKKYPQFDVILTGDNHQPFVEEYKGRLLVNPGSLSRQRTSETHHPRVYLYHSIDNTVTEVLLPIEENVISRDHLEVEEQREARVGYFVNQLSDAWEVDIQFDENLQRFEKTNQIRKSVMNIVYKAADL
jgi:DNA repair exonuclease SbcCD nuclease subunit